MLERKSLYGSTERISSVGPVDTRLEGPGPETASNTLIGWATSRNQHSRFKTIGDCLRWFLTLLKEEEMGSGERCSDVGNPDARLI